MQETTPKPGAKAGVLTTGKKQRCLICGINVSRPSAIHRHWVSRHSRYVTMFACPEPLCDQQMLWVEDLLNQGGGKHQRSMARKARVREDIRGIERLNQRYKSLKGKLGPDGLRSNLLHKTSPSKKIHPSTQPPSLPHPVQHPLECHNRHHHSHAK